MRSGLGAGCEVGAGGRKETAVQMGVQKDGLGVVAAKGWVGFGMTRKKNIAETNYTRNRKQR